MWIYENCYKNKIYYINDISVKKVEVADNGNCT